MGDYIPGTPLNFTIAGWNNHLSSIITIYLLSSNSKAIALNTTVGVSVPGPAEDFIDKATGKTY